MLAHTYIRHLSPKSDTFSGGGSARLSKYRIRNAFQALYAIPNPTSAHSNAAINSHRKVIITLCAYYDKILCILDFIVSYLFVVAAPKVSHSQDIRLILEYFMVVP